MLLFQFSLHFCYASCCDETCMIGSITSVRCTQMWQIVREWYNYRFGMLLRSSLLICSLCVFFTHTIVTESTRFFLLICGNIGPCAYSVYLLAPGSNLRLITDSFACYSGPNLGVEGLATQRIVCCNTGVHSKCDARGRKVCLVLCLLPRLSYKARRDVRRCIARHTMHVLVKMQRKSSEKYDMEHPLSVMPEIARHVTCLVCRWTSVQFLINKQLTLVG